MFILNCNANILIVALVIAYLLGSIPFGLYISKYIYGVDIKSKGSGNIGATNVSRVIGRKAGIATFLLDAGKGIIAVMLADMMCNEYYLNIYVGFAAVIGHIFPIILKFRGGKGVATALATITFVSPYIGVIMLLVWLVVFLVTRISSLAAISVFIICPFITYYLTEDPKHTLVNLILAVIILFKHSDNIKRLLAKTEK